MFEKEFFLGYYEENGEYRPLIELDVERLRDEKIKYMLMLNSNRYNYNLEMKNKIKKQIELIDFYLKIK